MQSICILFFSAITKIHLHHPHTHIHISSGTYISNTSVMMLEKWSAPYTAPGNSWIESIIFAVIYLLMPQNFLFLVSTEFKSVYAILYMINYFKPYHPFPRAYICRYYIVISIANVKTSYSLNYHKRFDLLRTLSQIPFVFYCGKRTFHPESFFLRTICGEGSFPDH